MGNCQPADVPFVIISSVHLWGEIALRYNIDWNIKSFLWHQETWVTILFCRDKWHSSCIPVAFLSPGYLFWRSKLSWGPERRPVNSCPISKWGEFTEIHRRSMKIYCMSCGMDFWSLMTYGWYADDIWMTVLNYFPFCISSGACSSWSPLWLQGPCWIQMGNISIVHSNTTTELRSHIMQYQLQ